jgi:hypothetical protein
MIPSQENSKTNISSPIPAATGMAMPDPIKESAPDKVSIETPDKKSTADKVIGLGHALSSAVNQGLSYANARRARETYNANDNL